MTISKQILLYCFVIFNIALVNSQNLRREETSLAPPHPFDQLSKRLEQLDWDHNRIDEVIRKHWKTDKTFLEYDDLSTSCLHTAAWIVPGLLELETRPVPYMGLFKLPKNPDLIVYNNTDDDPSTLAAPVIQSMRDFIASRPLDEPILLQVDMYQLFDEPSLYYVDHHFAIHIYNGQINLYQGWQEFFNIIDWMRKPRYRQHRYPMPVETFLGHFEKFLTYTEKEDEVRERLEATWAILGTTKEFTYGSKEDLDPIVRFLRHNWVVSLITHWPSPQDPQVN